MGKKPHEGTLEVDANLGCSAHDRHIVIADAMTEGIYAWDIDTGSLQVSPRLLEIIGLSGHEINAADWSERVHPDDFEAYSNSMRRHLKAETDRLICEYRIKRALGDYIWIADSGQCTRTDTGEAVKLVGSIRNITARKLAERRLTEARKQAELARTQLQEAIESISEGIVLFDAEDRIVLCNSNYRSYFEKAAGREVADMVRPGAVFWDFMRAAFEKGMFPLLSKIENYSRYVEMRKEMRKNPQGMIEQCLADGRWLQINEHRTSDGGIASVYTDVTELKKREVEASQKTETLEALSSRLSKYLSPQVYATIFERPDSVAVATKRKKLTIFFSDIVGFTTLVDALESEQLTELLNQYLTEMSKIAVKNGATVDKFIGDAVFAFFGDPVSAGLERDAEACVAMAREMQTRLRQLSAGWKEKGIDQEFQLRIGISTGYCTVGNFGSEDRLDYTAIGGPVNLASRLQEHASAGGILLDNETFHLVRPLIGEVTKYEIHPKGFSKPVTVFEVEPLDENPEKAFRVDVPGAHIRLYKETLADGDRNSVIDMLESAIAHIQNSK